MKNLLFVFVVVVLAFSCKKKEKTQNISSSKYYYLSGTITDTTNGNSVIDLKLELQSCTPTSQDILSDNTYSLSFVRIPEIECYPSPTIKVINTNDSIIARIRFPFSKLIEDCTVNIDLAF